MIVVKPINISAGKLTDSSIPEPDTGETVWTAGLSLLGDVRISTLTHRKYQCTADPSTTDDPIIGVNKKPPTWVDAGATNRYSMFDDENGSQSFHTGDLDIEITPNELYNAIAGFNITGATNVSVVMTDPADGEVYNKQLSMIDNTMINDFYAYFFEPLVLIDRFVLLDLPPYQDAVLDVNFETGGAVGVGTIAVGAQRDLGVTQYGTGWQALDFSIKDRDEFGRYKINKRRVSDLMDYDCYLPTSRFGFVKSTLKQLTTTPCVWVGNGDDAQDGTAVFGYYRDSQINISNYVTTDMTLSIEGLI